MQRYAWSIKYPLQTPFLDNIDYSLTQSLLFGISILEENDDNTKMINSTTLFVLSPTDSMDYFYEYWLSLSLSLSVSLSLFLSSIKKQSIQQQKNLTLGKVFAFVIPNKHFFSILITMLPVKSRRMRTY